MDWAGKWVGLRRLFHFENWVQLLANRLMFSRTKSVIHRVDGMEILMDYSVGEQNGTGSCVAHMSYAAFVQSFDIPRKHALKILDLGANGGGFPLMLRRMGYKFANLVAVEMNQRTFGRLSFNILRNLDGRISLINGAICERNGVMELPECAGGIGDSIYDRSRSGNPTTEEHATTPMRQIRMVALDDVIRQNFENERIDIVKIDIEGAEFDLLASPVAESLVQARHIIMEIHDHTDWPWQRVHEKMTAFGFALSPVRSAYEKNVFAYSKREL
jgi:FkbM family methyltransferase